MKKSLSFLAAVSTIALMAPLALAESSASSSAMSVSSSSSSSSVMMDKCASFKGLERIACVHQRSKEMNKDEGTDKRNSRAGESNNACAGKTNLERIACLRKVMNKVEKKIIKRATNRIYGNGDDIKQKCGGLHAHDRAQCVLEQTHQKKINDSSSSASSN